MVSKPVAVRCGTELLGWVSITGQDNYWTLGTFEPTLHFESYRSLFERELELSEQKDTALDEEDPDAPDERDELLERINELGLSVGDAGALVRDFKFIGSNQVEFKYGR